MKKKKIMVILFLVMIAVAINLPSKNFMWEIEGGKNKAYLLGSIHTMPKDVYPLNKQIEEAFTESNKLVVEVDPSNIDQKEMTNYIAKHAIFQDTTNLRTILPESVYKTVNEKSMEMGFQNDQIKVYKPWFVSINLGLGALQKIEVESGQGIDVYFLSKAKEREMPILELETALSQFEALSSMEEDVQKDILIQSLDEFDEIPIFFKNMLTAWKEGNVEKMNKLSRLKILEAEAELPGIRNYYNELFLNRDKKIAKKIASYLEEESEHTYFIIVGAVHLVGDDGLLRILQDKGYKIVQK